MKLLVTNVLIGVILIVAVALVVLLVGLVAVSEEELVV